MVTGTNFAWSPRTTATRKPSARNNKVFVGMVTARAAEGSLQCTNAYAPGRRLPVGLSTSTSTLNVLDVKSIEFESRTNVPAKFSPGNASRVKATVAPDLIADA